MDTLKQLQGAYPRALVWQGETPYLSWQYLGDKPFDEPFYEDTFIAAHSYLGTNQAVFKTPLSLLNTLQEQLPAVNPDGFIFHLSRCGSTLLSRMLSCNPDNIVIREAPPLDGVLRSHFKNSSISQQQRINWFKTLVSLLGRQRNPQQQGFYIKFDCWQAMVIPLIRQLYPEAACIFLYREPAEVIASHHKIPGMQVVPHLIEAQWYGESEQQVSAMSPSEYPLWVIKQILSAACSAHQQQSMQLLNFNQQPAALWQQLCYSFNCQPSIEWQKSVEKLASQHSKNSQQNYQDDSLEKQKIAQTLYSESQLYDVRRDYYQLEKYRQSE